MALSDAIASLGVVLYTVTHRANNGYDSHGRAVAPTPTTTPIAGMMQPLSGREIERLPEGLHQKELRNFWTTGTLVVTDSDTGVLGDHVTDASSVVWEVVKLDDWTVLGKYRQYVLSRVDA